MRNKKFKNKKILITGATGSVGTSVIVELIKNYDFKVLRAMSNDENVVPSQSKINKNFYHGGTYKETKNKIDTCILEAEKDV